ncbi:MAG: two-component sensor histidine kinase, partial [Desulfobacteraceae bacterium]|nr:two-component sensor histidine kinase [Desulfobacteraceae bacterium]
RVAVSLCQEGAECVIHVDDDGPGIPVKDRSAVFEPFVRLDTSRKQNSGGYGLGLAIVRRIVHWHGGRAEVSSSDLGGARFTLRWPAEQDLRGYHRRSDRS